MSEALNKNGAAFSDFGLLGEAHPLIEQLGACDGLTDYGAYAGLAPVRDMQSLRDFLRRYQNTLLRRHEWPIIIRAHNHARRHEARELIALDAATDRIALPPGFAAASRRVGQGHLQRLRPLRDEKVVQKYLAAVDSGQANGWHTVVFGVTLAIYSLPLRQGLILYARQTLEGFLHAAARPASLSAAQCARLMDELRNRLPRDVEQVLART